MLKIVKTIALALLVAAPALADRYEQTVSRTMSYKGGRVTVDHKYGNVNVRATGGNDVHFWRSHPLLRPGARETDLGDDDPGRRRHRHPHRCPFDPHPRPDRQLRAVVLGRSHGDAAAGGAAFAAQPLRQRRRSRVARTK